MKVFKCALRGLTYVISLIVVGTTEHRDWTGLCHHPTLGSKRPGLIPSNPSGLRMGERKEPRNSDILLPQKGVNRLQVVEHNRCLPQPQYNKIESLTNIEQPKSRIKVVVVLQGVEGRKGGWYVTETQTENTTMIKYKTLF